MTITSTDRKTQANGDGNTTSFNFSFFAPREDEVVVKVTNTTSSTLDGVSANSTQTLVNDTDYALTISNPGGSVDFSSGGSPFGAPSSGIRVTILRELDLLQETDYLPNDPFPAQTHEEALDRAAMRDQQIDDKINLTLRAPETDTVSSMELPGEDQRAGKALTFDANGEPEANDTATDEKNVLVSDDDNVAEFLEGKLTVASGLTTTVNSPGSNETLEIGVDEANIDHDALQNFVANEHVDHSSVNVNAGTGLSGGGDIASDSTLFLDIASLVDGTPGRSDEVAVDIGGTPFRETLGDILGLAQAADVGLGNVPNEDATDPSNWNQDGANVGDLLVWDGSEWRPAGTTDQLNIGGQNTFTVTPLSDDTAISFKPSNEEGILLLRVQDAQAFFTAFRIDNDSHTVILQTGGVTFNATTGSLNGTTGTDGNFTVSVNSTDGKIYLENRTNQPRRVAVSIVCSIS
jgi:hypothetical protein